MALTGTAPRPAAIPGQSLRSIGRGAVLAGSVVRYGVGDTVTLRLPVGELLVQAWTLLRVTATPALLMAIPIGALVSVQVGGLVNQLGATSMVGAASGFGVLRQGAPMAAGFLMGGVAAAAIASDLGARQIREELDALRAMGIDPVRRLVVPRVLALLLIAPLLCFAIIASAVTAAYLIAVGLNDVTPGSFWMSFGTFARTVDLWAAVAKTVVFAAIVGIVSSLRGIEARRGPRGVADAVNSAVVLNVVCIVIANVSITAALTMFVPMEIS
ncbi:ABC transporter permease [Mycolicibacterium fallax]|uniref:ABC transporter permease n=1 Tax=Mycolicibacterium fallax TaxID=1793 RepID=UPI000A14A3B2|nr:ABC transporter permease [Mycolicibacterium fallax]BBY99946.1 putative YrbE family protein [Mycolicibacterium fallax]HOW94014.1 ABC transporter permease [Mycolicibacterium fallax]HSA41104.1 ABC transporter permease [Mycobacterium sp.]